MKKIIILLVVALALVGCNSKEEKEEVKPVEKVSIVTYLGINLEDIEKVETVFFGVGGDNREYFENAEDIKEIYQNLSQLTIGDKTDMACEDNTHVYKFYLKNGEEKTVEIECNWFVIGKDRYLVEH